MEENRRERGSERKRIKKNKGRDFCPYFLHDFISALLFSSTHNDSSRAGDHAWVWLAVLALEKTSVMCLELLPCDVGVDELEVRDDEFLFLLNK